MKVSSSRRGEVAWTWVAQEMPQGILDSDRALLVPDTPVRKAGCLWWKISFYSFFNFPVNTPPPQIIIENTEK